MGIALDNGRQNGCDLPSAQLFAERLSRLIEEENGAELDSAATYKIVYKDAK